MRKLWHESPKYTKLSRKNLFSSGKTRASPLQSSHKIHEKLEDFESLKQWTNDSKDHTSYSLNSQYPPK